MYAVIGRWSRRSGGLGSRMAWLVESLCPGWFVARHLGRAVPGSTPIPAAVAARHQPRRMDA